jgi:hypothetical protein
VLAWDQGAACGQTPGSGGARKAAIGARISANPRRGITTSAICKVIDLGHLQGARPAMADDLRADLHQRRRGRLAS